MRPQNGSCYLDKDLFRRLYWLLEHLNIHISGVTFPPTQKFWALLMCRRNSGLRWWRNNEKRNGKCWKLIWRLKKIFTRKCLKLSQLNRWKIWKHSLQSNLLCHKLTQRFNIANINLRFKGSSNIYRYFFVDLDPFTSVICDIGRDN